MEHTEKVTQTKETTVERVEPAVIEKRTTVHETVEPEKPKGETITITHTED
ncbi:MAG TPA: hypothetical protein VGN14_17295 [Candidatus Elarobacter sp.]|jgi:hypothetical protein